VTPGLCSNITKQKASTVKHGASILDYLDPTILEDEEILEEINFAEHMGKDMLCEDINQTKARGTGDNLSRHLYQKSTQNVTAG
jgi:hypothetical protein